MFALLLNTAPPFLLCPETLGLQETSGPCQDTAVYSGQTRDRPVEFLLSLLTVAFVSFSS